MLEYRAAYFKSEGWYIVELVDFPGVVSQGKTLSSARMMIRDALKLMAEYLVEAGKPLPRPNRRAKPTMGAKPVYVEYVPLMTRFKTPVGK